MKIKTKIIKMVFALLAVGSLGACGGGSGNGTMSLGLTDQATEDYSAVYVTIDEVQIHAKGDAANNDPGWAVIANPERTYNLLDLQNGVVENLGIAPLGAGSYTQMRLIIGTTPDSSSNIQCHQHPFANYVIDADDGEIHELTIPSGDQTGIKIICHGLCDIAENQTTELILDFDAAASVVVAGNSGTYNLKPTIKVLTTADFSIVTGTVTNSLDLALISGATVNTQIFDGTPLDPADQIMVRNSTQTDVDGSYELFMKPGEYNLVAYQVGATQSFAPVAVNFTALAGQVQVQDFSLGATGTGTVEGTLSFPAGVITEPTFAELSFEQDALVGERIEVASEEVLVSSDTDSGSYSVPLPAGIDSPYTVVSSTCEFQAPLPTDILLDDGEVLVLPDILFSLIP